MESKRKTRKDPKASKAPQDSPNKPKISPEVLIKRNGDLVEQMYSSEVWTEIIFPLLQESISSVSGRYTNGRYYHGQIIKDSKSRDFLAGYQLALEEFSNRIHDFILTRDRMQSRKKQEALDKVAPVINTFTEDVYETED